MATFLRSVKWSAFSEIASKTITPIVLLVLARLLTPEDFGIVTAATMVVTFSQIFWEAGMSKALIQRQTDIAHAANAAFLVNLALGAVLTVLVYFFAPSIAHTFFQDSRVSAVLQVMAAQVLLGAFSSVHVALLQKEMCFERLFWVRLATVVIPGTASIPLALNGFGYWALVAGTLTGQIVQVAMLWWMSTWRPRLSLNYPVVVEMGRFGAWVGLSGLLAWLVAWLDTLIVGKYLGPNELGVYRVGNQLATLIFALIFAPIVPVLYSRLTRMNQDVARLAASLEKVIKFIILSAIPLAILIFSFSSQLTSILFGAAWGQIDLVLGVLALMHGFSWIVGMNGEAYRACGKPHLETWCTCVTLIVYVPTCIYAVKIGFDVFVWNRLALALGALFLNLLLLRSVLEIRMIPIMAAVLITLVISFTSVGVVKYFIVVHFEIGWHQLVIGLGFSGLLIGIQLFVIERNRAAKDVIDLIKG